MSTAYRAGISYVSKKETKAAAGSWQRVSPIAQHTQRFYCERLELQGQGTDPDVVTWDDRAGPRAEEVEQAAMAGKASEPSPAPAKHMLCEETELEPKEDIEAATHPGLAGHALDSDISSAQPADHTWYKGTSEAAHHNSDMPLQAIDNGMVRQQSPSAGAYEHEDPQESPAVPKCQRGKRSTRKRAASVAWGSSDLDDSSSSAQKAESAPREEGAAAPAAEAKPEDMLDNDEAIAKALAGDCIFFPLMCTLLMIAFSGTQTL